MGHHERKLTQGEVETLLNRLDHPAVRNECRTCECLQGFIAQLKLDAEEQVHRLLDACRVDAAQMHGSPGCQRCLPAEVFAEYLIRRRA